MLPAGADDPPWATMPDVTAEHYFSTDPGSPAHRREVEFTVAGHDYTLATARGVFSAERLDAGTAVLLRKAELPEPGAAGPFLDLGCGFGPITAVLATAVPEATVYAVDVNSRARELTAENARRLGAVERVLVLEPDEVPERVAFTQIWSNPPIRVGKADLHELLDRWLPRLTPDGVAWLVIARHLGGDSLQQWLIGRGWTVERHASQKGYRVLRVTR